MITKDTVSEEGKACRGSLRLGLGRAEQDSVRKRVQEWEVRRGWSTSAVSRLEWAIPGRTLSPLCYWQKTWTLINQGGSITPLPFLQSRWAEVQEEKLQTALLPYDGVTVCIFCCWVVLRPLEDLLFLIVIPNAPTCRAQPYCLTFQHSSHTCQSFTDCPVARQEQLARLPRMEPGPPS